MKRTIIMLLCAAIPLGFAACEDNTDEQYIDPDTIIEFKDLDFKTLLLNVEQNHEPTQIDTNGDGEISYGEASYVTVIDANSEVQPTAIESMEDLKYFTELLELDCSTNIIHELDLSNNPKLTKLYCSENFISTLDLSMNVELMELNCFSNYVSTLDLSNNTKLTSLICSRNVITELDLKNNTALTELNCWGNCIAELDITQNSRLGYDEISGEYVSDLIRCGAQSSLETDNLNLALIMTQTQSDNGIFDLYIANDVNRDVTVTIQ